MKKIIILLSICAFCLPAQAIYKCKDKQGRLTFSDIPCGNTAEVFIIKKPLMHQNKVNANNTRRQPSRNNKNNFLSRQERTMLKNAERRKSKRAESIRRDQINAELKQIDNDNNKISCLDAKDYVNQYRNELRSGCSAGRCERIRTNISYWKRRVSRYCK